MKNLVLYNSKLEIKSLLADFNGDLSGGVFNNELKYIEVTDELFNNLVKEFKKLILFKSNPIEGQVLTIKDFVFKERPAQPPRPLPKEQMIGRVLCELQLQSQISNNKQTALSNLVDNMASENKKLKEQNSILLKEIQALGQVVTSMELKK